jgi:hypothetical protein
MPDRVPRPGEQHPERWRADLNPDAMAGQNLGNAGQVATAAATRTAYDVKSVHRRLANLVDDDLKQIPVVPEGTRLEQGATYVDLNNLDDGEQTARGDMVAGPGMLFVAKDSVDYVLWNVLTEVETGKG